VKASPFIGFGLAVSFSNVAEAGDGGEIVGFTG
jgi:hypothetical protein